LAKASLDKPGLIDGFSPAVDINIVCHLISAGKREPTIGAYITLGFLISIPSPPVTAYRVINFSGPKYFNNGCRHLSSYQQSMSRSAGAVLPENSKNNVFGRRERSRPAKAALRRH
jgi:hypothetical protein